jgi:hypothetical protein
MGRGLVLGVTQAAQRSVQSVLADRPIRRSQAWEHQLAMPCEALEITKNGHGLRSKWHAMFSAHLGSCRRDRPNRVIEIELPPFGVPQLAGTRKQGRPSASVRHGCRLPLVALNGTEKPTKRVGAEDRRAVLDPGGFQGAVKRK